MNHRLSFVAEKASPCGARALLFWVPNAVHQKPSRRRQLRSRNAVIACYSWAALRWRRPVANKVSGLVGQTPSENTPTMSLGPRPRERMRPAKITSWTGLSHLVARIVEAGLYQVNTSTIRCYYF
jgi:hypothetical protein